MKIPAGQTSIGRETRCGSGQLASDNAMWHSIWLVNVLNRASVESATKSGTALYEQDLATCLKDNFKELIDELIATDAAVSDAEFDD